MGTNDQEKGDQYDSKPPKEPLGKPELTGTMEIEILIATALQNWKSRVQLFSIFVFV